MRPEAYRRARKLLDGSRAFVLLHGLGWIQAVVTLVLLAIFGLLLGLSFTHGEIKIDSPTPAWLPAWAARLLPEGQGPAILTDSGLLAVAGPNIESPNPVHRAWGRFLLALTRYVPPLRYNLGVLLSLLSVGLGLALVLVLASDWRSSVAARLASELASTLRRQIHRQMYRLGQSALPSEGIESIQDLFSRSVDDIQAGALADLTHSSRAPAYIGLLVLAALLIHWPLAIALLALGSLGFLASRPLIRRAGLIGETASRNSQVMMRLLAEDLGMLRTVRVFGMEAVDNRRFDEHLEGYRDADSRRRPGSRIGGTASLLFASVVVLGLALVGIALLQHPPQLSSAAAVVLVLILLGLIAPVLDLVRMAAALRPANRASSVFYEFLDRRSELTQASGAQFLAPLKERIRFENVSVKLHSGKLLLEGVDFEILAGSRVAIMGRDEEAKQGLVCLIPRLIDPAAGRVRIDGQDLRNVTLESLRAQVAMVLQNDTLFSDSVAANIGLGDASFTLPRIIEAAKVAHAHNFIQDLPNGYDTVIGPLGHYLRADEQYRLALARIYLHDPTIVIIEEPAAAIDDEVKLMIDDSINRLARGRTMIFLPHRLSTIRSAEQVIVLHNGRLEAVGAPRELQATNKIFRHLQYVEFNQFAGDVEEGQVV